MAGDIARGRLVAVAVDKGNNRGSREALRWLIDHNLVSNGQTLMIVHVNVTASPTLPQYEENGLQIRRQLDETMMDVLTPYVCFCKLRQVECEPIVLQHKDVAEALREFILFHSVDTFVLGGVKRHPLARIIKGEHIQKKLENNTSNLCEVYGIYNGRLNNSKSTLFPISRPCLHVTAEETISREPVAQTLEWPELITVLDSPSVSLPISAPATAPISRISSTTRPEEFSFREVDFSQNQSERQSTDSSFISFYKGLSDINRGLYLESMNQNIVSHYAIHSRNT